MSKISQLKDMLNLARGLYELDKEARKADTLPLDDVANSNISREFKTQNPIRQSTDEDDKPYLEALSMHKGLMNPEWPPQTLYKIFDESDILQRAIRARIDNMVRPYDDVYVGPKTEENGDDSQAEKKKIDGIFGQCNEKHSWLTVRRKKEMDKEVSSTGGFVEVLSDRKTLEPILFYHVPGTWMRVTALDEEPTLVYVKMTRDGEVKDVPVSRRFRRFGRALPTKKVQWFKEFGDPRILNKNTGEYYKDKDGRFILEKDIVEKKLDPEKFADRATEIWWFRDVYGGQTYQTPEWCSAIAAIRGKYLAAWCNYDVLDHGGTPPWLLMVFGRLAKGTKEYLQKLIQKWRDPTAYSDPGILEIEPNLMSFSSQGGAKAGAEFVSMRDMRSEEAMFSKYSAECRETIGGVLGVPPVLYGHVEGPGGTNYASLETFQTQVIEPMQMADDERVNVELLQSRLGIFRWKVKSRRIPIGDLEQLYKALGMVTRGGGGSSNDITEEENRVFGTQWKTRVHPFYSDLSMAEGIGLIRQNRVMYHLEKDEQGNEHYVPEILPPPTPGIPAPAEQSATGEEQATKADQTADQLANLMPIADTINILTAMQKVEERIKNYKPPTPEQAKDVAL